MQKMHLDIIADQYSEKSDIDVLRPPPPGLGKPLKKGGLRRLF